MITHKQLDLLHFIHGRTRDTGVPPSFDEMKDALDLKSKSGIHRMISGLEERGYIRRLPNRARAIEVLRAPEARGASMAPRVAPGEAGMASVSVSVPVMGRIAAGTPVSAIQDRTHSVTLSQDFLAGGEHFALEVRGDSMVDAGILDGDLAVIRRQDSANTGDIVVALIDGEEATLKRLRTRGGSVALEAANPAYATRILEAGRVRIQGRLVSIVRRY